MRRRGLDSALPLAGFVLAALFLCTVPARADWKDYLQSVQLYEGDAFGTTVHDIYLDKQNPTVNQNGNGLLMNWGDHAAEKNAYIDFGDMFGSIPEGSFIYKATLTLTASGSSTGAGAMHVGARANAALDESTTTYSNISHGDRHSRVGAGDQLYANSFSGGNSLTAGEKVSINVTPSVRAWLDHEVDAADGYQNNGFAFNINPFGAGATGGDLSFYDSETGEASLRPQLTLEYLEPRSRTQPFKALLFLPTSTDTAHVVSTSAEDTSIRHKDTNQGLQNLQDNNFGARPSIVKMQGIDGAAALMRFALEMPGGVVGLEAAEFRFNGSAFWNNPSFTPTNFELRELLKAWVEGNGGSVNTNTGDPVAGATYNSFNRSDSDATVNPWETPGGTGASDSLVLAGNNFIGFQYDEMLVGSADLTELVARWLAGEENNGLMLRTLSNGSSINLLQYNLASGYHTDPYLSPGLLLIFEVPEPASAVLLLAGLMVVASRRRRLSIGAVGRVRGC